MIYAKNNRNICLDGCYSETMFFQGMQYEARGAFFCLCVCVCFKIHQKKNVAPRPGLEVEIAELMVL